jgi:hypothetical protein
MAKWYWIVVSALLLCLVFLSGNASGNGYYDGYYEDGYTYHGSYWWRNGKAYTRTKYYTGQYEYSYGNRYRIYLYRYDLVYQDYVPPSYQSAIPLPKYGPGWKEQALKYAESRDDYQAYLDTLARLGIQGQTYSFQRGTYYGASPALSYAGSQGSTQYGYSYQALKEAYGETSINALYQQAARLTQGSQDLGGRATADFMALVNAAGEDKARIAEILANAEAMRKVMEGLRPQARVKESTTVTGSSADRPMERTDDGQVRRGGMSDAEFVDKILAPRCAACHSGKDPSGKLDLGGYLKFTPEQKDVVISRIYDPDPKRRMPFAAKDGTPGKPLPALERAEFAKH